MHTLSKYISQKQMDIIILMLKEDIITFKEQNIFKNNFSFKRYMKDLHDKKLILKRRENGGCNEYTLSDKGEFLGKILKSCEKDES